MITNVRKPKNGQVRILQRPVDSVRPAAENEKVYRPVDPDDPEVRELARSIAVHGVQEPIVITRDNWILSGHRRHTAAILAGLTTIPCRVQPISRAKDPEAFIRLLREFNRQRVKSFDEKLREEIVSANADEAYESLIEHRKAKSAVQVDTIEMRGRKRRSEISKAKAPFLEAIKRVLDGLTDFWPTSDREVHYELLNDPPLKHASKPDSTYSNTLADYKSLVDLLTRARLEGIVPWEAIADATRPMVCWQVDRDVQTFVRTQLDGFLKGYWRDLMQSQPNHIEIVGEKNTLAGSVRPVAARYCIPYTLGRGYCCIDRRYELAKRFIRSGKERLVLLFLSDFDPDGEEIAHSFARSMRDDFGIENIEPIKVALTAEQVEQYALPPSMKAKKKSANYEKFVGKYGDNTFEMEALKPALRQQILSDAIDAVIDIEAFNAELNREKEDSVYLHGVRETVLSELAHLVGGHDTP